MRELSDLTDDLRRHRSVRDYTRVIVATLRAIAGSMTLPEALATMPKTEHLRQKAGVSATTTDNAGAFVGEGRTWLDVALRSAALTQLGPLTAPPYFTVPTPQTEPAAAWVMDGEPMPLARIAFDDPRTSISKFGFLQAFSLEWIRSTDPRALGLFERVSMNAMRHAEDTLLLSDTAAVANGAPAGLLNGVTPVDVDTVATVTAEDLEALWTSVRDGEPDRPFFVLSGRAAIYLAGLHDNGVAAFPDIGPLGGTIYGVPAIISKAAGNKLILVDASQLVVTDDGMTIEPSRQASVQFDSAPTNDASTGVGAQLVSAFQNNVVVVRFVRFVHWLKVTDDAVAYMELPISGSPA